MKRFAVIAILLVGPVLAVGQNNQVVPGNEQNRQVITPPPVTQVYNGGYGGWGGGGQTPEGAALQGMSQVISAQGQANLANSAAAINWTQAESNSLQNQVQGVQTFWAMRDIGREEREKERGPRPTPEELARRAAPRAPPVEHESDRSGKRRIALAQRICSSPCSTPNAPRSTNTPRSG